MGEGRMNKEERDRLEDAGWGVGTADDFLDDVFGKLEPSPLIVAIKSAKLARWLWPDAKVYLTRVGGFTVVVSHPGTSRISHVDAFLRAGFTPWTSEKACQEFSGMIQSDLGMSEAYCRHLARICGKHTGRPYEPHEMADALYATMLEAKK